jgi:hypothetical protein
MKTMTKAEALDIVLDIASRWGENAEEGLTTGRVDAQMIANDEVWTQKLAEMTDDDERDQANEVRDLWTAIETLKPGSMTGGDKA